jgi:spore germination protein GerM
MKKSLSDRFKREFLSTLLAIVVLLAATIVLGCDTVGSPGDGDPPTNHRATTVSSPGTTVEPDQVDPGSTVTTSTTPQTTTFRVYFARDLQMAAATRVIPRTQAVGAAAMKALLEGPTALETEAGMFTGIPDGTKFLDLTIDDGVAFVDLSAEYESGGGSTSFFVRMAQVVFTLTQFPTVDSVRFKLEGELVDVLGGEGFIVDEPLSRDDYEEYMSPAILVESPTVGMTVDSPMRITGTANVFEAVFQVNIVDWDGLIIAEAMVMASSGSGVRGTFDVTIPFEVSRPGLGALVVFSESPRDGSQINVVEIPLRLE